VGRAADHEDLAAVPVAGPPAQGGRLRLRPHRARDDTGHRRPRRIAPKGPASSMRGVQDARPSGGEFWRHLTSNGMCARL